MAYGDYDTPNSVVETSGPDAQAEELLNSVNINGGGDFPEASKTAIFTLLREIQVEDALEGDTVEREHLVFLFTGTFFLLLCCWNGSVVVLVCVACCWC